MSSSSSQRTDFSLDVMGRYICNGLDEAIRSTDQTLDPDAKQFDYIVIGGGSFGSVFASHIFNLDQTRGHRILVLAAVAGDGSQCSDDACSARRHAHPLVSRSGRGTARDVRSQ